MLVFVVVLVTMLVFVVVLVTMLVFVVVVVVLVIVVVVRVVVVVVRVVVVVVVAGHRSEFNDRDVVGHVEHRRTCLLDGFNGVFQALLQVEAIGNDQGGILHPAPVLQRGLERVGITAGWDEGDDLGQAIASHVGRNVSPDGGCGYQGRNSSIVGSHTGALGSIIVIAAPPRDQCQREQQTRGAKNNAPGIDNESHSCKCMSRKHQWQTDHPQGKGPPTNDAEHGV